MKQILSRLRINSSGDTIVEVLICVALVSVVLVGAFAVSTNAQHTNQDSSERDFAVKIGQAQLESIRNNGSLDNGDDLCFDNTGQTFSDPTKCSFDSNLGSNCTAPHTANLCYSVTDNYNDTTGVYTATVTWQSVRGTTDSVNVAYKMPPVIDYISTGPGPQGAAGTVDPCTLPASQRPAGTTCPPAHTPGHINSTVYEWGRTFLNTSPVSSSIVSGCKWVFSDVPTTKTNVSCNPGDKLSYTFQPVSTVTSDTNPAHAFPYYCTTVHLHPYNVKLTEFFNNGAAPVTYTYSGFAEPTC